MTKLTQIKLIQLEAMDEKIDELIEELDTLQTDLRAIHGGELCDCGVYLYCPKKCPAVIELKVED